MYSAFMQYNEVLVTGGTGLLGRYVCQALIGHGFMPRLLASRGPEWEIAPDVRARCRITPGELTVRESVEMGAQGTSAIVHLAEVWKKLLPRGVTFEEANLHATANILYAASAWGIRRLIFVGVAGAHPGDLDPSTDVRGKAEALVRESDRLWTVFRPAPWYDLRGGKQGVSTEYLKELAGAIAESVRRRDTAGRVYEDASKDRSPWKDLSRVT